jgi:ABC-type glycerol-3-phosphate transport system permease component
MVVTTLQVIAGLKIFVPIYVLTSGGPANASLSLYFLVFQKINQYKLAYGIWNTREGLILPYVALLLPPAIWIMRGTFLTMPK